MNNYLNSFIRSIIESITEFLPVSSTGHLFFYSSFFPFDGFGDDNVRFDDLFDIFIQSGAILSVIVIYFYDLKEKLSKGILFAIGKEKDPEGFNFWILIATGSFPVLITGFIFKSFLDIIKSRNDLLLILGLTWFIGGLIIILTENYLEKRLESSNHTLPISVKSAFLIGIFQCIALIPGVSRSAATIITARILGYSRKTSAEFSFFVAIPVLIAAGLYKLYKYRDLLNGERLILLTFGFVATFLFCMVIIKWFLNFIKRHSFAFFGYYRILIGIIAISYFILKN